MRVRPHRFELALVAIVALAVLAPGLWNDALIDPWETHYGEVARVMRQDHDYVHTDWPQNDEGFRSKPVLTFWMMAAGMTALGVAHDGGYSGEMIDAGPRTMLAIRGPFVLAAIGGLLLLWYALAVVASRRIAWLALLVVGTAPLFALVARQAIPDTPMVACTIGAIALFVLATEDGDRPAPPGARRAFAIVAGALILVQAAYYAHYVTTHPIVAPVRFAPIVLPILMCLAVVGLARDGFTLLRLPVTALGGLYVEIRGLPRRDRRAGETAYRYALDVIVDSWDRHAPDRYAVRALLFALYRWRDTDRVADAILRMRPLTTMRQVYLLWAYVLVAIAILAKGPPGVAVVGGTIALHAIVTRRFRAFEIKRGLILVVAIAIPWHVAMYYADGPRFVDEYWGMHILSRGTVGIDDSTGTFAYYTEQLGYGMYLWAALLPGAIVAALRTRDPVRRSITLWALVATTFFALVTTKFHHYILPAVPPLAILVGYYLDDLWARRERFSLPLAITAIGITALVTRDLAVEPKRWIEMFVFMYTRAWPADIDPSDGFLALGLVASLAILALAIAPRLGVIAVATTGLAIALWSLHAYMPVAAKHWGMRDAIATYYRERTIYGDRIEYYDARDLAEAWRAFPETHTFETLIPDALQVGQPMTVTVSVHDEATKIAIAGRVAAIGDHAVTIRFLPNEVHRLDGIVARGLRGESHGSKPVHTIDADRLLAWQLYWRGENLWTGDEIWGPTDDTKTAFKQVDNVAIKQYLGDPKRAPVGRRYFMITEPSRVARFRDLLPTDRALESFEILDESSNKFTLTAFVL